ncbi:MAG: PilZ domain-containing protein [Rhodopseudomonas sp.]|uniref:PilZ domain-containing protein n=1 Tax=Rhodopseudomonas sp. TaxID=1078 RepID=UPI0017D82EF6|nr:PilZ domain-containing protein [Rhodopseudomonas sp.]NVN87826.1 PilZ domain-containing protein [Rhodopseudomonas sp.]
MAAENSGPERVTFGRGYNVWIMAIDGTWRRSCVLKAISAIDAELGLEGSIEGLNLKEFFLLLSSTGLAYRRCELVRVNGSDIDVRFLKAKSKNSKAAGATKRDESIDA